MWQSRDLVDRNPADLCMAPVSFNKFWLPCSITPSHKYLQWSSHWIWFAPKVLLHYLHMKNGKALRSEGNKLKRFHRRLNGSPSKFTCCTVLLEKPLIGSLVASSFVRQIQLRVPTRFRAVVHEMSCREDEILLTSNRTETEIPNISRVCACLVGHTKEWMSLDVGSKSREGLDACLPEGFSRLAAAFLGRAV